MVLKLKKLSTLIFLYNDYVLLLGRVGQVLPLILIMPSGTPGANRTHAGLRQVLFRILLLLLNFREIHLVGPYLHKTFRECFEHFRKFAGFLFGDPLARSRNRGESFSPQSLLELTVSQRKLVKGKPDLCRAENLTSEPGLCVCGSVQSAC